MRKNRRVDSQKEMAQAWKAKEKAGKVRSDLHSARGRLMYELLCYSNAGEAHGVMGGVTRHGSYLFFCHKLLFLM